MQNKILLYFLKYICLTTSIHQRKRAQLKNNNLITDNIDTFFNVTSNIISCIVATIIIFVSSIGCILIKKLKIQAYCELL